MASYRPSRASSPRPAAARRVATDRRDGPTGSAGASRPLPRRRPWIHSPTNLELDRQAGVTAAIAAAEAAGLVRAVGSAPAPAAVPVTRSPCTGPATMPATGSAHPCAKLGPDDVREIRRLKAQGTSAYAIAKRPGVQGNTIRAILTGGTWRDV